ncbi:MAG: DUF3300 domain-containing protein [Pseudoxanthomonas sp.]
MRIPLLMSASILAALLGSACSRDKAPEQAKPAAAGAPAVAQPQTPASAPAKPAQEAVFSQEELDQMLAPIALYPDPLLAQVLMAATYPGDVADAAAWSRAHRDAKGDSAVAMVANEPWDPSVQALVAFPQALATLGQDPAWVQRLGDAFLAQPEAVMDATQRLRRQAQANGNLSSNEYQKVSTTPAGAGAAQSMAPDPSAAGAVDSGQTMSSGTIVIEPADPAVVYVPAYNPTVVYGAWNYPSYPPAYYPPPPGYYAGSALVRGLAFGTGVAIADSLWGGFDWDDNDIDIDVNRYNNINVNRRIDVDNNTWRHNAANRDGVPYRDRANREMNSRRLDGATQRADFRGEDAARSKAREQARNSMQKRGVAPAASNRDARDTARRASDRELAADRSKGLAQNQGARDRARAATQDPANRDKAQDRGPLANRDAGDRRAPAQAGRSDRQRQPAAASHRASQNNTQARQAARKQQNSNSGARNNAFAGARQPSQSRAQASRGQASHASAQRPSHSRAAGKPVQRQSRPPQRQATARRR